MHVSWLTEPVNALPVPYKLLILTWLAAVAVIMILLDWVPAIKQTLLPVKLPAKLKLGHGAGTFLAGSTLQEGTNKRQVKRPVNEKSNFSLTGMNKTTEC